MLLEGMFLPLTTPFDPGGGLHLRKLEDNVTRYSKGPAAGLVVLAASGQPTLLSDAETRAAFATVARAATAEKVLVAGVTRDSVRGTLELIAYAGEVGYDVALVPVPTILRGGLLTKELLTFFRTVADGAALPVVLDNSDGEISAAEAMELAEHPGIIGIVASGAAERVAELILGTKSIKHEAVVTMVFAAVTKRMLAKHQPADSALMPISSLAGGGTALSVTPKISLKTRTKSVGFQVLYGRTGGVFAALQAGAVAAMPPLAASAPQVCYEVLAAWKDGDPALAAEKQERLREVALHVEEKMGVAGIKYGGDLNGYFGGRPRLPALPLTSAERSAIDTLMANIRN